MNCFEYVLRHQRWTRNTRNDAHFVQRTPDGQVSSYIVTNKNDDITDK